MRVAFRFRQSVYGYYQSERPTNTRREKRRQHASHRLPTLPPNIPLSTPLDLSFFSFLVPADRNVSDLFTCIVKYMRGYLLTQGRIEGGREGCKSLDIPLHRIRMLCASHFYSWDGRMTMIGSPAWHTINQKTINNVQECPVLVRSPILHRNWELLYLSVAIK